MPDGQHVSLSASASSLPGKPLNVRSATLADNYALFDLVCRAHQENGALEMNPVKVRTFLERMLRRGADGLWGEIGVIDGDHGDLAGSVCIVLDQWWFTDEWILAERWNYVAPEYRQSTYAKDLINYAKWFSDGMKLPLEMGIITTHRTEAKVRLYRRQLRMVGAYFVHGLERANGPLAIEARANV